MIALVASVCLFLAVVTGAVALASPTLRLSPQDRRLRGIRAARGAPAAASIAPTFRRPATSIPALARWLRSGARGETLALELERANLQLRVGEYVLARLLIGALVFLLGAALAGFGALGFLVGLAAGVAGYAAPALYVKTLQRRRKAALERQLSDLAPMLASALRSGFGLQQGLDLAAQQLEPPMADELKLLINDLNVGSTMEDGLLALGRRIGSQDIDMLVTAILVQRQTGGNLAEVLDQAAATLAERERIRGDVRTLTTQHRLTGLVLSVWPIAIGLVLLLIMPSMWSLMFTETAGRVLLGVALGLQAIGFYVMQRVMQIEI